MSENRGGGGLSRWAVAAPAGPSTQGVGGAHRPREQAMGSSGGQHANPLAGCPRAWRVGRRVVHGVRTAHNLRPVFCATAYTDSAAAAPRPLVSPGLARLSAGPPLVLRAGVSPA
jgi:hypothetical protein